MGCQPKMGSRYFVASFENEHALLGAVERLRSLDYQIEDVYCPYPVHGLDQAMGLAASKMPWVCFIFAGIGTVFAFLFQAWVSVGNWPIRFGGKPFFSWPSFVPVTFEVAVLFAGLGSVAVLLISQGLFPWSKKPVIDLAVTDSHFLIVVKCEVAGFDEAEIAGVCREFKALQAGFRELS